MPRFRDENDFPDVEAPVADRRSFSNEVVRTSPVTGVESGRRPVKDRDNDPSPREELDDLREEADAVQSPKLPKVPTGLLDDEDEFIDVSRPADGRREINRSSNRWPSTLWGASARLDVKNASALAFANPTYVIPCIERQVRREVLFAKRRTGGGGKRKPRRRSYWSQFRCD